MRNCAADICNNRGIPVVLMLDDSTSLSTYFEGCVLKVIMITIAHKHGRFTCGAGGEAVGTEEVHVALYRRVY